MFVFDYACVFMNFCVCECVGLWCVYLSVDVICRLCVLRSVFVCVGCFVRMYLNVCGWL